MRDGVQLREGGNGLLVGAAVEDHGAQATVKLAVEVILRDLTEGFV